MDDKLKEVESLIDSNVDEAVEKFVSLGNSTDISIFESLASLGDKLLGKLSGQEREHEKGRILGTLGNIYYSLGKFDEAEELYLKAIHTYIDLSKKDERYMRYVGGALFNLGNLYQIRKKYDEAEKAYKDAIRVFEFTDSSQLAAILTSLGTLHAKTGNLREAEKEFLRAFEYRKGNVKNRQHARELGVILNNLAVIYINEKREREAEILLKKAFETFEELGYVEELASVIQNFMSFIEPGDSLLDRLAGVEDSLPADLAAKIKFIRAKKAEKEGNKNLAAEYYLDAACLSFIAYRNFGFQSVNFIHCFEKAEELGIREAGIVKTAVLRVYLGASVEVSLGELEKIGGGIGGGIGGSVPLLSEVAKMILHDISG